MRKILNNLMHFLHFVISSQLSQLSKGDINRVSGSCGCIVTWILATDHGSPAAPPHPPRRERHRAAAQTQLREPET